MQSYNSIFFFLHIAKRFSTSIKFPLAVFYFSFFLLFCSLQYSAHIIGFEPVFYTFKFHHFSRWETEAALWFRLCSRRPDRRVTGLLAYPLSLTVNLDDRSAGGRARWVWAEQPWPHFCWIRLMLQTGYHDLLPAVVGHAAPRPSFTHRRGSEIHHNVSGGWLILQFTLSISSHYRAVCRAWMRYYY